MRKFHSMADVGEGQIEPFVDLALEKAERIEQALGHLAQGIELGLVDIALDPSLISNGSREKFELLGKRLAELAGVSYELAVDISTTTGVPLALESEAHEEPRAALSHATAIGSGSVPEVELVKPTHSLPTSTERSLPSPLPSVPAPVTPEASGEPNEQEDLYRRIVDPSTLPEMLPVDADKAIDLRILANNKVRIGTKIVTLGRHEVYIFNALLTLRDQPRPAGELKAFGFAPDLSKTSAIAAFSTNLNSLAEAINKAAGHEVIKKLGKSRGTMYAVNPNLVLSDERTEADLNASITPAGVKKN